MVIPVKSLVEFHRAYHGLLGLPNPTVSTAGAVYTTSLPNHNLVKGPVKGCGKKAHSRRTRKGKKSTKEKSTSCRSVGMYYVNVNGYKSKGESIKQLIEECIIDILLSTETKVYSKTTV